MNHIAATTHLTFAYGRKTVLQDVDLEVPPGSFYGLLGANGAGKTTLLKILIGLLRQQGGAAQVLGCDSRMLDAADWTRIGYVSEAQPMYDWYTGAELIAFTRRFYPNWDDDFCRRLAEMLRLPLARKVSTYSKGERMKMSLLLAMAFHPRLLLLDEPFSGLDVLAKEQLIACMLEITRQEQWSAILASHDLAEVERLADSIGLIEEGRLKINEPLETLQARFRRIQVFDPAGTRQFVEPAFSPEREQALRAELGPNLEITSLSLREIVLSILSGDIQ